jgi:hypothetical protein
MNPLTIFITICLFITGCQDSSQHKMKKIIFLHHSTGNNIWVGKTNKYLYKLTKKGDVQKFFIDYNKKNSTNYNIAQRHFPKDYPYGWNNYPYDYYNIWVKNAGNKSYLEEPTLEILTKEFDVIIFKHCFPVSRIKKDSGSPDINSDEKRIENYKQQYNALKKKMHEFPGTKFIIWTPAVCTKNQITEDEAKRTNLFYKWIVDEWDEKGDNIFIWDFYKYETEGNLYLPEKNAVSSDDSHPNNGFSARVAPLFCKYIIDVIECGDEQ